MNHCGALPKVNLRALEPEDLELLYSIENDTRLWNVCTTNVPYSKFALTQYISNNTSDIFADRQLRLMVENEDGAVVGIIDIVEYEPRFLRAELGIVIRSEYQHRGYAAATIARIIQYAKNMLHLHQLYAFVAVDNEPSIQLFQQAGFIPGARLKDWFCNGDDYIDAVVMQFFFEKVG